MNKYNKVFRTEYTVDINDNNGFVKQLDVFNTYEEAINFIVNYDLDDLEVFIGDNINVVKYLCGSIEPETVVKVLIKKLEDDDFTEKYIKDLRRGKNVRKIYNSK